MHNHSHCNCKCGLSGCSSGHSQGVCSCCGHHECSCKQGHAHEHDHADFSQQLLEMADAAWMEVLKDKMKEHIKKSSGEQLDQLAGIVAEANKVRWKNKMANHKVCSDYKERIHGFFWHDK